MAKPALCDRHMPEHGCWPRRWSPATAFFQQLPRDARPSLCLQQATCDAEVECGGGGGVWSAEVECGGGASRWSVEVECGGEAWGWSAASHAA